MCEICWRMRCPRACPAYERKRGRRRGNLGERQGGVFRIAEPFSGLENRMDLIREFDEDKEGYEKK